MKEVIDIDSDEEMQVNEEEPIDPKVLLDFQNPAFNSCFETRELSVRWRTLGKKKLWLEKVMHVEDFDVYRVSEFLTSMGLLGTVSESG